MDDQCYRGDDDSSDADLGQQNPVEQLGELGVQIVHGDEPIHQLNLLIGLIVGCAYADYEPS